MRPGVRMQGPPADMAKLQSRSLYDLSIIFVQCQTFHLNILHSKLGILPRVHITRHSLKVGKKVLQQQSMCIVKHWCFANGLFWCALVTMQK